MYAGTLYVAGSVILRVHASTTEGTLLCLEILREVGAWGYRTNQFRRRIVGVAGLDTIDV